MRNPFKTGLLTTAIVIGIGVVAHTASDTVQTASQDIQICALPSDPNVTTQTTGSNDTNLGSLLSRSLVKCESAALISS